jgi:hypothetical protein
VARASLQDLYVRLLLDRLQEERYPNPDHLDRIEAALNSPEQLQEYVELLFERVAGMKRPSPAMLDRIQRFAALQQQSSRRRA